MGSKHNDRLSYHLNQYAANHGDKSIDLKHIESQLSGLLAHNRLSKNDLLTLSKDLLPPLAQLQSLHPHVVAPLVKLTERTDDPKSTRMAHYLLQASLGEGCGGTPTPPKGSNPQSKSLRVISQSQDFDQTPSTQLWRRAHKSEGAGMEVVCALRHLAAYSLSNGEYEEYAKILGQCLAQNQQAAAAAERKGMLGFMARGKEAQAKSAQLTKTAVLYGSLSALRVGMSSNALVQRLPSLFHQSVLFDRLQEGVCHSDSRIARHAMAVLCQLVDKDERNVLEIVLPCLNQNLLRKTMPGMAEVEANQDQNAASVNPSVDPKSPPQLNVADSLCRMYLSKLLGKLLFCSLVDGKVESKRGTVIFMALTVLATKDPSYTVSMEAVAAISGATILKHGSLRTQDNSEEVFSEQIDSAKMASAWKVFERKFLADAVLNQGDGSQLIAARNLEDGQQSPSEGSASLLLKRIISAIMTESPGEVCCACNAACALMKARSFSNMYNTEQHTEQINNILSDLVSLLWSLVHSHSTVSVTVRCQALCALVWCNDCVSPEILFQIVRGGRNCAPWGREFEVRVLEQLQQKVAHMEGQQLLTALDLVGALFMATPAELRVDELGDTLQVVLSKGQPQSEVVLAFMNRFVFEVNSEGQQAGLTSFSDQSKRIWVRHRRALVRLQCYCTWWLGQYSTNESGDIQVQSLIDELVDTNESIPYVHFLAQQQKLYPVLSISIGSLVACSSVCVWEVRCAALRALAMLALRVREPFRFQCYSILQSITRTYKQNTQHFFHNKRAIQLRSRFDDCALASVAQQYLSALDYLYKGTFIVQQLVKRYGSQINRWPEKTEEAVKAHHAQAQQYAKQCINSAAQLPLGERCAILLNQYGDGKGMEANEQMLIRQQTLMQISESQKKLQDLEDQQQAAQEDQYYEQEYQQDDYNKANEQTYAQEYEPNDEAQDTGQTWQEEIVQQEEYLEDYIEYESGMPLPQDAVVVYSFQGENAGELTVNEGDLVIITGESEGGWLTVEMESGDIGLVPQYYVKVIVKEQTQVLAQKSNPFAGLVGKSVTDNENDYNYEYNNQYDSEPAAAEPEYQQYGVENGEEEIQGLVAFDFFAEAPGEMTVYAGQYVKILAQVDEDWYQVEREGDVGFVPVAFIEAVQQ